jgi:hypothetical protein
MPFDPDHFRQTYPGRAFPELRFCAERQRWHTDRQLAACFRAAAGDSENVLWDLFDRAMPLDVTASATLRLGSLLAQHEIEAGVALYIDWYLGEQAQVARGEMIASFDAYWQKGVDDMAVFDDSFAWVFYFTRDGGVRLLRADEPPEEQE